MSILVVFSGLPATGKSSVAARLLGQTSGLHLSTDETRERLFPRAVVGEKVKYGHQASKATYEEVEALAGAALAAGTPMVILDGTYLRPEDRARAIELGLDAGAEVLLLEVTAGDETIRKRLQTRRPGAEHFSEADLAVYRDFLSKLSRGDEGYSRPSSEELSKWRGRRVVGACFDTDTAELELRFGAPSASLEARLETLASDLAR